MLTFTAPKEINLKVLQFLYDDARIEIQVSYRSYRLFIIPIIWALNWLLFIICTTWKIMYGCDFKVFTDIKQPDVYSATALFRSANFMERETYDFFGVNFIGHPNLIRILNVDEMDYFPLRKEYPLEDQTRIDKDDEMFGR
jgi:NADH-quinone oxidoreductase subunit C